MTSFNDHILIVHKIMSPAAIIIYYQVIDSNSGVGYMLTPSVSFVGNQDHWIGQAGKYKSFALH